MKTRRRWTWVATQRDFTRDFRGATEPSMARVVISCERVQEEAMHSLIWRWTAALLLGVGWAQALPQRKQSPSIDVVREVARDGAHAPRAGRQARSAARAPI